MTSTHLPAFRSVAALGARQGGIVSRRQLYALGVTRWQVTARIRSGAWARLGDQSIHLHTGRVDDLGALWAATFQGGPRAVLDGDAALVAAGLERWKLDRIRVSVPRGARVRRNRRFNIRQTRRWQSDDREVRPGDTSTPPRTRPPVAAVRGALWAQSDTAAALLLTMAVQQRIVDPLDLAAEMLRVRRDKRRRLLHAVTNDLIDGAHALGELDVVRELRRRGLPLPERQVVRRDGNSRYFLDMYWPAFGLVVEVDGIHHRWAENIVADALRQNVLSMRGDVVLRLPLLGLRLESDTFFGQIEQALRRGGWTPDSPRNVIRMVG